MGKYDYIIGMDDSNIRDMKRILGGDPEKKFINCFLLRMIREMWPIPIIQRILMCAMMTS